LSHNLPNFWNKLQAELPASGLVNYAALRKNKGITSLQRDVCYIADAMVADRGICPVYQWIDFIEPPAAPRKY
jgi:hypothetical protein